jgi:hypothetical protein
VANTLKDEMSPETGALGIAEPSGSGADRRSYVRVTPDKNNGLAATLASGSDIRLIDLSKGGAQFECDRRFLPNAAVSLRLLTRDGEVLVTGRVVRSRIVRLVSGGLGYLVAVAFAKPLQSAALEEAARATQGPTAAPATPATPVSAVPPDALAVPLPVPPARVKSSPATAAPGSVDAVSADEPETSHADISAEEALYFETCAELAPAMLTVTAAVDRTSEQLHDMFGGNDW